MGIKQVKLHPAHVAAPEVRETPKDNDDQIRQTAKTDERTTQPIIQTQIATDDELALIRMMEEMEQSGQLSDAANNNTSSGGATTTATAAGASATSLTTTSTVGDDQEEEEDMSWLD